MREMRRRLRAYFLRQRAAVLIAVDALGKERGYWCLKSWLDNALPDLFEQNELLVAVAEPMIKDGLHLGGAQIAAEIDGVNPFALDDQYYAELLPYRMEKIKGINATTVAKLQEQFKTATEAGETLHEIKDRVKATFKEASEVRANAIARTETAASVNQGRKASMQLSGVTGKAWRDAGDAETRDTHAIAGAEYRDGIPIDQMFVVGGYPMDHPSDPAGPAHEVVNCRCVMLPVILGRTNGDLIQRYRDYGFESWKPRRELALANVE